MKKFLRSSDEVPKQREKDSTQQWRSPRSSDKVSYAAVKKSLRCSEGVSPYSAVKRSLHSSEQALEAVIKSLRISEEVST